MRRHLTLSATLLLAARCAAGLAENAPAPPAGEEPRLAHTAWGSDPAKRCPDLRQAGVAEGAVALVQFRVGPTGVPSQASIRSSSGSAGFDGAAVSCVLKLRFQPSVRFGDGVAVESWQQLALKSEAPAAPAAALQTARCEPPRSPGTTDAQEAAGAKADRPGPLPSRAGVCVCVDETGRLAQPPVLTNSSGIAGVDKAALELSSAASYHPATSATGAAAAGCFHFTVGIEVK
ncbi:MAG TPA: TonB family protein [Steroidobacteraceae bacterium]|nr:TonB family protein [Steroidobacteraceae bacterium]